MARIDLHTLSRRFGATRAADDVTLSVPSGAFLALLGPSGCGKTTLLRLIAGLERPDSGTIRLGDRTVASADTFVPPEDRALGMVFQSYALWPHMTVAGNIRFGLRLKKLGRPEEEARITEALAMVGLQGMEGRKPHELSGGQRQRVALARSLALRPDLILLDEPLANLDTHLRGVMLAEFRRLHAALGTTFVFVTHDQDEAMAVATHVGVMNKGRLEQLAAPEVLFRRPATPMVARFVGNGRTLPVHVTATRPGFGTITLQGRAVEVAGDVQTGPAWLCLRAHDLRPSPNGPLHARLVDSQFRAGAYAATALVEGIEGDALIDLTLPTRPHAGEPIRLDLTGGWLLPREGMGTPLLAEALQQDLALS